MSSEERTKRKVSFDQIPGRQRRSLEAQLPKKKRFSIDGFVSCFSYGCGCLIIVVVIFCILALIANIFGGSGGSNGSHSTTPKNQSEQIQTVPQEETKKIETPIDKPAEIPAEKPKEEPKEKPKEEPKPKVKSLGEHWIKDAAGVYLWNPQPQDGESITWSGGYVQEGGYRYADGAGVVRWYRNGKLIQTDEGAFVRGRHDGHFKHTFKSGRVDYSNWDNGVEIPDTSEKENRSKNPERRYVGTYNSGMKAYIVPGTLKVSSDRKSCNVKISAEDDAGKVTYLDYHIWKEGNSLHFSNSEGYSGVITSKMIVENNIWNIAQQ